MPNSDSRRIYDLLDTLVALRLEYVEGVDGKAALERLGEAKAHEVRTSLDKVIADVKLIIDELEGPPLLP